MNSTSGLPASPLANRTYRHLYFAQISALTGTGVMTVSLALLAYRFAGEDAAVGKASDEAISRSRAGLGTGVHAAALLASTGGGRG